MNRRHLSANASESPESNVIVLPSPRTVEELEDALIALEASSRASRIAIAAYYRAEERGFAPGGELDDWLSAEREVE
jgi:hypothetical protein